MTVKWKFRDGKWRRINVEFEEQKAKTLLLSQALKVILENDYQPDKNPKGLTPEEQHDIIQLLPGLTAKEMESVIPLTGPTLADSIRQIISKHRATDRSFKDQHSPQI